MDTIHIKSEKKKMLDGEMYDAFDEQLSYERIEARVHIKKLNDASPDDYETLAKAMKYLVPNAGKGFWAQPPFYCDYGYNIHAGDNVFFDFNCMVLDGMPVRIGSRTIFGPNVQVYTTSYPMNHRERGAGLEAAKSVIIGEDVCVGGGVVICPGVRIGDRSVIEAGSVVNQDIPADVFAGGHPCKIVRSLA